MAVRTVTVDLRLNATSYLADGRAVVRINREIDRGFGRIATTSRAAASGLNQAGDDMRTMARRARSAERRVHNLREEIDRLIAAQAALRAAGPIPPMGASAGQGGRMGGGMLRGLMGAFNGLPPQAQAAIGGGVALAISSAAPLIGSAFAGALLLGLGTGGLAAGIAAAAKDESVRDAFASFGKFVKGEFESYGDAFEVPLINSAVHFRDRWASISPEIRELLAEASRGVEPLAEGLAGFVEEALPGLQGGMEGAMVVVDAFAAELPDLGRTVGDFFDILADGSDGAADGLVAMVEILEAMLLLVAGQINWWEDLFSMWSALPDWLTGSMFGIFGAKMVDESAKAGEGLTDLKFKVEDTRTAFDVLTESVNSVNEGFMNGLGAAIAYEDALDGLAESVKENGRSLDITSEKGRNNARALMDVYEAAKRTYDANLASGMSAQQAAAKYNEQIGAANRAAIAAGMAADQVNRLAQQWHALPTGDKVLTYTVRTKYVTEGSRPSNTGPGVLQFQRDGGVHYARDGLMGLSGNAGVVTGGRPLFAFAEPGTGAEAFIARNAPRGRSLAIANEAAGWHGGMVVPKGWAGGGGGTAVTVNVYAGMGTNGREVGEQIISVIQPVIARRGGRVQFAVMGKE